jgi:23S rRNA pseudouridine1911/1915/1917 synthase
LHHAQIIGIDRDDYIGGSMRDLPVDGVVDESDVDESVPLVLQLPAAAAGQRLDKVLASMLADVSRSRLQQWIEGGAVRIDGVAARLRQLVAGGESVEIAPPPQPEELALLPEPIDLDIVYEDASITVIDKPAGLVVHPAAGHWSGTLANGLLARFPQVKALPRAGIVHRLDAGTSGLLVVALTLAAQTELVRQLQARSVTREYWAIVSGSVPEAVTIDAPLARDPRNPLRFAVSRSARAKPARTHLRRIQTVGSGRSALSWVACRLETGRTHQIRVHLESIGHPLIGDPVYRRGRPAGDGAKSSRTGWQRLSRQALHACRLGLVHPQRPVDLQWFRPPPSDMRGLMRECGFADYDSPVDVFR